MNMINGKKNTNSNNKYLTRCHYYGKLIDWEYVSGAIVLKLKVYTATEYYGSNNTIRIYVPTDLENIIKDRLIINENYLVVAAPYRVRFADNYRHRVDMLINIFQEII